MAYWGPNNLKTMQGAKKSFEGVRLRKYYADKRIKNEWWAKKSSKKLVYVKFRLYIQKMVGVKKF